MIGKCTFTLVQWARTARQWELQKIESRGTDQVRKLTAGCYGAFQALSSRHDAIEEKMNAFNLRFQRLEDGIDAILQRLEAHPVNNQPAPVAAVQGKSFVVLFV
jgi:hypothetical protein